MRASLPVFYLLNTIFTHFIQATIQTRAKTGPTCSGSLITEHHVLLSAACVHRYANSICILLLNKV